MMIHKRVMELTKGVRTGIVCKALIGVAISATYIVQAATLGTIVGLLYKRAAFSALLPYITYLAAIIGTRLVLIYINSVYGKKIIGTVKNILRRRIYAKLLKLGPAFLDDERTGTLGSTMVSGVDYLEGYLTLYLPQVLVCFIACSAMLVYIFQCIMCSGLLRW